MGGANTIIDSHVHVLKEKNFDRVTEARIGHKHPEDTPIELLVRWLEDAGVGKAVIMGQDCSRIWNSTCGEDYVLECVRQYPDLFLALASVEPLDKEGKLNRDGLAYFDKAVKEFGFKGLLLTPPYGYYSSDNPEIYPYYEKALELDAVVQFHHCASSAGIAITPFKYINPQSLNNVLIDFPGMKVVIEHLNYPWYEELFWMMMNPDTNLYADLAMMYHRPMTLAWNLVKAKEHGVIDKIMYASDYWVAGSGVFSEDPGTDMNNWIELIKNGLNRITKKCGWPAFTQDEIDGILFRNAASLYGINVPS